MTFPASTWTTTAYRLGWPCAALIFVAACSGGAPTAPSGQGTLSNGGTGAVIEGVVSARNLPAGSSFLTSAAGSTATVSAASQMQGMTVSVAGTNLSASVGADGTFLLMEVPNGTVRLTFRGGNVDATVEVSGVSDDQAIRLTIEVSATSAVVVDDVREGKVQLCHAEGRGSFHSIVVSESAETSHRAHGDGKVDESVPGRSGLTFDANCRPEGAAVDIEKSTNGEDADSAPGVEVEVGESVFWEYVVRNTGTLDLTDLVVSDDRGVAVDCGGLTTLAAEATLVCTGAGVAALGPYANLGTVTAKWESATANGTVTDTDASHYQGVEPDEDEDSRKVTLCHKTGNDRYVKINVSVNAEPAHRAHGDAEVGEPVPGLVGKVFDSSCSVQ